MNKTLEPMPQELVVKASKEAGFSNTVDAGQFFKTRPISGARGRSTAPYCKKKIPDQDPPQDSRY